MLNIAESKIPVVSKCLFRNNSSRFCYLLSYYYRIFFCASFSYLVISRFLGWSHTTLPCWNYQYQRWECFLLFTSLTVTLKYSLLNRLFSLFKIYYSKNASSRMKVCSGWQPSVVLVAPPRKFRSSTTLTSLTSESLKFLGRSSELEASKSQFFTKKNVPECHILLWNGSTEFYCFNFYPSLLESIDSPACHQECL